MALSDIFGSTIQIEVVDFLTINYGSWYNLSELSSCIKIPKPEIFEVLPQLIYNGIVDYKIEESITVYTLSKNYIHYIKRLVFANGLTVSTLEDFEIEIESIRSTIGEMPSDEPISYYDGEEDLYT